MFVLVFIFVSGCQGFYDQSQRELADKDILVKTAANHHRMISFRVGAFDGFYEGKEGTLSVETVDILGKLKQLGEVDPNSMTEYELGYSWGLQANMLEKLIKGLIEITRYLQ